MSIEIEPGKGRPVKEAQSAKLSSEIGIISRKFMPIPPKWKNLDEGDKDHAYERLQSKFEIGINDDYVRKSVNSIMQKSVRQQRYRLHQHFKKFDSPEEARRNLPTKYNISDENWDELCKLWTDESFKERCRKNATNRLLCKWSHNQGSRAFVASRAKMIKDNEEPDRIEFFKRTHWSEKTNSWRSTEAENAYKDMEKLQDEHGPNSEEPLSVDEIVDKVLGKRSGYVKGLGYGPIPAPKEATQSKNVQLEEKLKNTEEELENVNNKLETMETHYKTMETRYNMLINALIGSGQFSADFMVPSSPAQVSNNESQMHSPSDEA